MSTTTYPLAPAPVIAIGLAGHLKRSPIGDPGKISPAMLAAARATYAAVQREHGFRATTAAPLLTAPDANVKIAKSERLVWSLTLAPAMSSGLINTCVRFADCESVCVLTSGKGGVPSVVRSRAARTDLLFRAPDAFAVLIAHEIDRAGRIAARDSREWRIRLNAASDIPWEIAAPWVIKRITDNGGAAYDYTKSWARDDIDGYTLCRSVDSRHDVDRMRAALAVGRNVAVILPIRKGAPVPSTYLGMPAIDGDVSDDRTADPRGVVVILRAKGKLRMASPDHPMLRGI